MKKLTRKIKKLWQWLTVQRYVDIHFGTAMTDKDLADDLQRAKENIQIVNYQKIMQRLIKYEIDLELATSGLLLTENAAIERALIDFQQAKRDGKINELNEVISEDDKIYG